MSLTGVRCALRASHLMSFDGGMGHPAESSHSSSSAAEASFDEGAQSDQSGALQSGGRVNDKVHQNDSSRPSKVTTCVRHRCPAKHGSAKVGSSCHDQPSGFPGIKNEGSEGDKRSTEEDEVSREVEGSQAWSSTPAKSDAGGSGITGAAQSISSGSDPPRSSADFSGGHVAKDLLSALENEADQATTPANGLAAPKYR